MTVTRLGADIPLLTSGMGFTSQIPSGGGAGQVPTSNGSNGVYYGPNVATITANGSNANTLLGPFVNFAAGSNVSLSTGSNTLTIHSTSGSLTTKDEGSTLSTGVTILDFVGAGVVASGAGATTTITIGGGGTFAGVRVNRSTTQSVNSGSVDAVQFDQEDFDTNAFHDNSTNNTRLTVPTGLGGYYAMGGSVDWASNGAGERYFTIRVNGSTEIAQSRIGANPSADTGQVVSSLYALAQAEYIEFMVYQNTGGALNVAANARGRNFWMYKVG
jgi:hypothetical protein